MHSCQCTMPCPQCHKRTEQWIIRMYFSPLVSGHKSSCLSRSTFYPLTLANSILVVITNMDAAMCTRQRQNRRRACAHWHIITTYCLLGKGTRRCCMGGASVPLSSRCICSRTQDKYTGREFHRRMLPPTQDRTPPRNETFDPSQWPPQNPTYAANFLGGWSARFCRKPVHRVRG